MIIQKHHMPYVPGIPEVSLLSQVLSQDHMQAPLFPSKYTPPSFVFLFVWSHVSVGFEMLQALKAGEWWRSRNMGVSGIKGLL